QLAAYGLHGERNDIGITAGNRNTENAGEVVDLREPGRHPVALIRLRAVAHCLQVGDEIGAILWRKAELEHAIEMRDHLVEGVVRPVVEIRRIEIRVQQSRGFEQSAVIDGVLLVIDETGGRDMTSGATELRIVRKRLGENHLAPVRGVARSGRQVSAETK